MVLKIFSKYFPSWESHCHRRSGKNTQTLMVNKCECRWKTLWTKMLSKATRRKTFLFCCKSKLLNRAIMGITLQKSFGWRWSLDAMLTEGYKQVNSNCNRWNNGENINRKTAKEDFYSMSWPHGLHSVKKTFNYFRLPHFTSQENLESLWKWGETSHRIRFVHWFLLLIKAWRRVIQHMGILQLHMHSHLLKDALWLYNLIPLWLPTVATFNLWK